MMESEVMGNYHASFGERDGETRPMRVGKVRAVPTLLSPILANIYLHELDCYVESLITEYTKGKVRGNNPEYFHYAKRVSRLNKKIEQENNQDVKETLLDIKKATHRRMLKYRLKIKPTQTIEGFDIYGMPMTSCLEPPDQNAKLRKSTERLKTF